MLATAGCWWLLLHRAFFTLPYVKNTCRWAVAPILRGSQNGGDARCVGGGAGRKAWECKYKRSLDIEESATSKPMYILVYKCIYSCIWNCFHRHKYVYTYIYIYMYVTEENTYPYNSSHTGLVQQATCMWLSTLSLPSLPPLWLCLPFSLPFLSPSIPFLLSNTCINFSMCCYYYLSLVVLIQTHRHDHIHMCMCKYVYTKIDIHVYIYIERES